MSGRRYYGLCLSARLYLHRCLCSCLRLLIVSEVTLQAQVRLKFVCRCSIK